MSEHRLNEIVIERPRRGMRLNSTKIKGVQKSLHKLTKIASEDGLLSPYLIKTRNKSKYFSDHLAPLRRLLGSKVGQPWDDVYSELCQRLHRNTVTGLHVMVHVWDFVIRYVEIIDGVPYQKTKYFLPIGYWRNEFYIHPETGILCLAKKSYKDTQKNRHDVIVIDEHHEYRKIRDIWYWVEFEDFPVFATFTDVLLNKTINIYGARYHYNREIYAVSKRQCNKKELRMIKKQINKYC